MVVAYYMPHNEGVESGILDKPGQDTGLDLVDLYEVDGKIATFNNKAEAEAWLEEKRDRRKGLWASTGRPRGYGRASSASWEQR